MASFLRYIVRNDAMREDPPEIYNWRVISLVCASCFGGMVFGWDTGAIGGILSMDSTQQRYGFSSDSATIQENIVSTLQVGCFVACLITSWLTEKYGRRWCLIGTGVVTTIGVIFQAASAAHGQLAVMYVGRFIAGLGVGAGSTLAPLYVSECAPRAIRGGLTAFYQLFIVIGIMVSFWVNYGSSLHVKGDGEFAMPLALQALPALLLILGMLGSPESPRWCARKDNWEKASRDLAKLRGLPADSDYVRTELQEISKQLEDERRLTGDASAATLWKEIATIPGNRKRALISISLMIFQQMTGANAINYYAPQILTKLGLSSTTSSLFATGVYGIVKTAACSAFLLFAADSLGRRRSLLWTGVAQGIAMYIIGIYGRVDPPTNGKPISAFGYVGITCIYLWAAFYQFGWGAACWIYVSEIPTARLRALNVAIAAATQWLFNFIIARTVLNMQQTMGDAGYGMFFMFGSFCFIMSVFVWFFVPETKGLSLEQMDELFGVTELVKNLDNEPETGARSVSIHEDNVTTKE